MAFQGRFIIDGKSYIVLECTPSFDKLIGSSGEILAPLSNGQLKLLLEVHEISELDDLSLWFEDANLPKDGAIVFYKKETDSTEQYAIEFSSAYCIQFIIKFTSKKAETLKVMLTISAQHIEMSKIDFNNLIKF